MMRSRNAVVALKPDSAGRRTSGIGEKQERRGGIETWALPVLEPEEGMEAGTPWWH